MKILRDPSELHLDVVGGDLVPAAPLEHHDARVAAMVELLLGARDLVAQVRVALEARVQGFGGELGRLARVEVVLEAVLRSRRIGEV